MAASTFCSVPKIKASLHSRSEIFFLKLSELVSSQAASLWIPRRQTVAWTLGQNAFPLSVRWVPADTGPFKMYAFNFPPLGTRYLCYLLATESPGPSPGHLLHNSSSRDLVTVFWFQVTLTCILILDYHICFITVDWLCCGKKVGSVITIAHLWEQVNEPHQVRCDTHFLCYTSFPTLVINFQIFLSQRLSLSWHIRLWL